LIRRVAPSHPVEGARGRGLGVHGRGMQGGEVVKYLSINHTITILPSNSSEMIRGTLLIVDGNSQDQDALRKVLKNEIETIHVISNPNRIPEMLRKNSVDIVLLGMNFRAGTDSGNEGLFWLQEILSTDSDISIIMITANGNIELAVKAIREGAVDFIQKPWDDSKLISVITLAWKLRSSRVEAARLKNDNRQLKREINRGGEKLVAGASPTMIHVMNTVRKVASTNANVLITGENGTGKELVAREIHRLSGRSNELMVTVDMGSLTESLFESELFGHVKGAFTDAVEDRQGKFEQADRGTLFLDEIGNISLRGQSKLLSVLQNRNITRVGSNRAIPVDIRLICATNCNLQKMVEEGTFREDLFYRINTIIIEVPPLRDRVDDIPILAGHFLRLNGERYGKPGLKFNTHTLEKLSNHDWPGNIRELQHAVEKAVILSDSNLLKPSDFSFSSRPSRAASEEVTIEEMEKKLISESLQRNHSNLSVVASKLGITRQTLYNKLRKYDLDF
jgi:DNA-binding NtrC family response regulator